MGWACSSWFESNAHTNTAELDFGSKSCSKYELEPRAGFEPATLRGEAGTRLSAYEADALRCPGTSTRLSHRGTKTAALRL